MNRKLGSEEIFEVCNALVSAHGERASNSMVKQALLAKYGSPNGGARVADALRAAKAKRGFVAKPPAKDLFANAIPIPESGCWLWDRAISNKGYGKVGQHFAHRLAWEAKFGQIPEGMYVCHRCDVRSCINPAHLFLGTPEENAKDCSNKGRLNRKSLLNLRHIRSGRPIFDCKAFAFPTPETVTITVQ